MLSVSRHFLTRNTGKKAFVNFIHKFIEDEKERVLRVGVLGLPNSGKSTLVNKIVGSPVCPVSSKVHTTRKNARGIITQNKTQIIFTDTPGVISDKEAQKYKIQDFRLVSDPGSAIQNVDLLLVLHDLSSLYSSKKLDSEILKLLCLQKDLPSILVLNKIDIVKDDVKVFNVIRKLTCNQLKGISPQSNLKGLSNEKNLEKKFFNSKTFSNKENNNNNNNRKHKEKTVSSNPFIISSYEEFVRLLNNVEGKNQWELIQELTSGLRGWPGFSEVFTISALQGLGIENLKTYLLSSAVSKPHLYTDPSIHTDKTHKTLVLDTLSSKLLEVLPFDIPYKLVPKIVEWQDSEAHILRISISIESSSQRITNELLQKKILKKIACLAERDLQAFFETEVFITLSVDISHPKKVFDSLQFIKNKLL